MDFRGARHARILAALMLETATATDNRRTDLQRSWRFSIYAFLSSYHRLNRRAAVGQYLKNGRQAGGRIDTAELERSGIRRSVLGIGARPRFIGRFAG